MRPSQYWQNFELGKELEIACGFIYDGLRNLHEMETLHYETEIFSVLYNLSVGFERILKVSVVLLEYHKETNFSDYEKSLITHNHLDLLRRIKKHKDISFGSVHNDFLDLLGKFYKSYRYDRYCLGTVTELSKEKRAILGWLNKYLNINIEENPPLQIVRNDMRIKKFVGKVSGKILASLYSIIDEAATAKNLYTYEVRYFSKAYKLLLGKEYNFEPEDILWKELIVFLKNAQQHSKWLEYIQSIDPLEFDAGLISEYLQCFSSEVKKIEIVEELESLYDDVDKKGDRLQQVSILGDPNVFFDEE
jgi:hypothetical protein